MTPAPDSPFALLVADVYELAGVLRRYGDQIAATAGQTQARWQLISVISEGEWTVPQAADRLGTSRQAVQRVANDLVADGLAHYVANPHHQRSPFLALTDRGTQALKDITRHARSSHKVVMGGLDGVDMGLLRQNLRRVTEMVRGAT